MGPSQMTIAPPTGKAMPGGIAAQSSKENNFDLVRLCAAAQVMLGHAIAHLQLPISTSLEKVINAFPGVPMFFVVSGFLITGSYRRQGNIRRYAENRWFRIFPALWVNLIGITLMLAIAGNLALSPTSIRFWLWHVDAFLFGSDYLASKHFQNIFSPEGAFPFYPSGVLWTLPVELSFYIVLPVIVRKSLSDRGLSISLSLWAAASLICLVLIERSGSRILFIGLYLWIFLLGAAAQVYWRHINWAFKGKALYWIVAHLALTAAIFAVTGKLPVYVIPSFLNIIHTISLAAVAISCVFSAPKLSAKVLRHRDMSYGLYLWHMPVFCTFVALGLIGSWALFFVAAVIAILVAYLSMVLIERPALRLKRPPEASQVAMA